MVSPTGTIELTGWSNGSLLLEGLGFGTAALELMKIGFAIPAAVVCLQVLKYYSMQCSVEACKGLTCQL